MLSRVPRPQTRPSAIDAGERRMSPAERLQRGRRRDGRAAASAAAPDRCPSRCRGATGRRSFRASTSRGRAGTGRGRSRAARGRRPDRVARPHPRRSSGSGSRRRGGQRRQAGRSRSSAGSPGGTCWLSSAIARPARMAARSRSAPVRPSASRFTVGHGPPIGCSSNSMSKTSMPRGSPGGPVLAVGEVARDPEAPLLAGDHQLQALRPPGNDPSQPERHRPRGLSRRRLQRAFPELSVGRPQRVVHRHRRIRRRLDRSDADAQHLRRDAGRRLVRVRGRRGDVRRGGKRIRRGSAREGRQQQGGCQGQSSQHTFMVRD